jgi:hypothetical protein
VLAAAGLALAGVWGVLPAVAAGGEADRVTWSVRPGDKDGPDGRPWIELELEPGQEVEEHMVVTNHGPEPAEFRLSAADGLFTESGRFTILPSTEQSADAGTWIDLPESVEVAANSSAVVGFSLKVPENATPGDHPAGVAAGYLSTANSEVGLESRVGFRVMVRVAGELKPAVSVKIDAAFNGSLNPLSPGSLRLDYSLSNQGNTILKATPEIVLSGPFGIGRRAITGEEITEMAPGETRSGTVRPTGVWPLGFYKAQVIPRAESADGAVAAETLGTGQASAAALPWPQLATLGAAAALALAWRRQRRMTAERVTRLVAEAREDAVARALEQRKDP